MSLCWSSRWSTSGSVMVMPFCPGMTEMASPHSRQLWMWSREVVPYSLRFRTIPCFSQSMELAAWGWKPLICKREGGRKHLKLFELLHVARKALFHQQTPHFLHIGSEIVHRTTSTVGMVIVHVESDLKMNDISSYPCLFASFFLSLSLSLPLSISLSFSQPTFAISLCW